MRRHAQKPKETAAVALTLDANRHCQERPGEGVEEEKIRRRTCQRGTKDLSWCREFRETNQAKSSPLAKEKRESKRNQPSHPHTLTRCPFPSVSCPRLNVRAAFFRFGSSSSSSFPPPPAPSSSSSVSSSSSTTLTPSPNATKLIIGVLSSRGVLNSSTSVLASSSSPSP